MASIVERKTAGGGTKYLVMVRLKGHPVQCATFARKTDAKRWASQTETEIRNGRYFRTAEAQKHSLSDLIDRYLREGFQHKPGSLVTQKRQLEWWKAELGAYTLEQVTAARISECRSKLLATKTRQGGVRSPATVNRFLAALSDCFTDAVKEYHWVEMNPVLQVKKFAESKGRTRFLSNDIEKPALLKACTDGPPGLYLIVLLALTTGARQGELLAVTWADIDLKRGVMVFRETKNGDTRAVPIMGEAVRLLAERGKVRAIDNVGVFADWTRGSLRHAFDVAMERAKITDFRFHDLRHTAASYLLMSGASLAELAGVLGHKTLQMVKRYSHLTDQHTAGILTKMTAKYFG